MVADYEPPAEGEQSEQTMVMHDARLEQKFAPVPYEVVFMRGLSRDAKHTYTVLLSYAWKHNKCFPGMVRLCADLEASEPVARRFLRELQAYRLIRIERRGLQRTNLYHFLPVADAGAPPTLTVVPRRIMSPEQKTRFNQERKKRFTPERNAGHAPERKKRFTPTKEEVDTGEVDTGEVDTGEVDSLTNVSGADAPRPARKQKRAPSKEKPPTQPSETRLLAECWMKANEIDLALAAGAVHKKYNAWAAEALKKRNRDTLTRFLRWAFTKRRAEGVQYDIVPHLIDERIGQWHSAGEPERYEPPPPRGTTAPPPPTDGILRDSQGRPIWLPERTSVVDHSWGKQRDAFVAYWHRRPELMTAEQRAAANIPDSIPWYPDAVQA